jgi:hypothetical protein
MNTKINVGDVVAFYSIIDRVTHKAIITKVSNGKNGIVFKVNKSSLPFRSDSLDDEWVVVHGDSKNILMPWSKYEDNIRKKNQDEEERRVVAIAICNRIKEIEAILNKMGIFPELGFGEMTLSLTDLEKLLVRLNRP